MKVGLALFLHALQNAPETSSSLYNQVYDFSHFLLYFLLDSVHTILLGPGAQLSDSSPEYCKLSAVSLVDSLLLELLVLVKYFRISDMTSLRINFFL